MTYIIYRWICGGSLIYLNWMTRFGIDLEILLSFLPSLLLAVFCFVLFRFSILFKDSQIKLKLIINIFYRIYETMQNKYHKYNHKNKKIKDNLWLNWNVSTIYDFSIFPYFFSISQLSQFLVPHIFLSWILMHINAFFLYRKNY